MIDNIEKDDNNEKTVGRYRMPIIGSGLPGDAYRPKHDLPNVARTDYDMTTMTVAVTAELTAEEERLLLKDKEVKKLE